MAINLIDMAKGYLTDAVVSRVSNNLGESPEGTQKALMGALPVILGGLISRSSTPEGPGFLSGLLQRFAPGLGTSATVAADDEPASMMQRGSGVIESLFGSSSGLISGALAQFAGVKSESASGLMGMAGSLLTGSLANEVTAPDGKVDTGGLLNLLSSQKDAVAAAMPSGLSALMGNIPGLGALGGMLGGLTGAAGSAMAGVTGAAGSALSGATSAFGGTRDTDVPYTPPTPAYRDDDRNGGGFNFWPWLLALLAAGLIYYFVRGCGDKKTDATSTTMSDTTSASTTDATATADSAASTMGAAVDTATSAVSNAASSAASALGAFGAKKLPDGVELNIPANGIENKLIAFIEDSSKPVDKTTWFNFDRLLYETGSAKLKPESREQLQNIAAILKAYPAVNLKIGGYTDNVGNAASNKRLSQARAESAMKELVALGVAASRLEAEGYGQEIPVASNDTEEGRAQNRRTAARVTKK